MPGKVYYKHIISAGKCLALCGNGPCLRDKVNCGQPSDSALVPRFLSPSMRPPGQNDRPAALASELRAPVPPPGQTRGISLPCSQHVNSTYNHLQTYVVPLKIFRCFFFLLMFITYCLSISRTING